MHLFIALSSIQLDSAVRLVDATLSCVTGAGFVSCLFMGPGVSSAMLWLVVSAGAFAT